MNRRSLFSRLGALLGTLPFSAVNAAWSAPAIQGSQRRSIQKKVDEVTSLADQLEIDDFDDASFAARLAFQHANTAGGRGVTFRVPPRVMTLKAPLAIPDRVVLAGSGIRDTIFFAQHDGPLFLFRDVQQGGLSNMRLGLGRNGRTEGIRIEARSRDVRRLSFSDLEIAGGGQHAIGQVGLQVSAAGKSLVTECTFDRISFFEVDRPVVERSTEGNEWTRFVIDQFGYTGGIAFDSVANANHYQGRIAGQPAAGAIGFRQSGYRNILLLRVDVGNTAHALDLGLHTRNIVMLQRPFESGPPAVQTPIGQIAGITIIDGDLRSH